MQIHPSQTLQTKIFVKLDQIFQCNKEPKLVSLTLISKLIKQHNPKNKNAPKVLIQKGIHESENWRHQAKALNPQRHVLNLHSLDFEFTITVVQKQHYSRGYPALHEPSRDPKNPRKTGKTKAIEKRRTNLTWQPRKGTAQHHLWLGQPHCKTCSCHRRWNLLLDHGRDHLCHDLPSHCTFHFQQASETRLCWQTASNNVTHQIVKYKSYRYTWHGLI